MNISGQYKKCALNIYISEHDKTYKYAQLKAPVLNNIKQTGRKYM